MPKKKVKKTKVAKGVSLPKKKIAKLRKKAGSSNVGEYKNVKASDFAGAAGGASKYSYPINTLKRAKAALAYARNAPNPEGIKRAVYKKYPQLKKRMEERKGDNKKENNNPKNKKKKFNKKVETVMREFKEKTLNMGKSKKKVKKRKQAVAIALSEARKATKKKK